MLAEVRLLKLFCIPISQTFDSPVSPNSASSTGGEIITKLIIVFVVAVVLLL